MPSLPGKRPVITKTSTRKPHVSGTAVRVPSSAPKLNPPTPSRPIPRPPPRPLRAPPPGATATEQAAAATRRSMADSRNLPSVLGQTLRASPPPPTPLPYNPVYRGRRRR